MTTAIMAKTHAENLALVPVSYIMLCMRTFDSTKEQYLSITKMRQNAENV